MSDEIVLGNTRYVSSKRAARDCGYAQDYVGQLARTGIIDAQRVGGLWYVSMESLEAYKRNADSYKPQVAPQAPQDPDTIICFDGKDYISAAKAARVTGYNPDYVGQLARSGKVLSRQVGNRWYVDRDGLLAHKSAKDAMLASVQAESVGLARPILAPTAAAAQTDEAPRAHLTYVHEADRDLMPTIRKPEPVKPLMPSAAAGEAATAVPIRIVSRSYAAHAPRRLQARRSAIRSSGKTINKAVKATAMLTVVIVLSYGFVSMKSRSIYAVFDGAGEVSATAATMSASAASAVDYVADLVERLVSPELTYTRH